MKYIEIVKKYKKTYNNWLSVLYQILKGEKIVHVVLKNGEEGYLKNDEVLYMVAYLVYLNELDPYELHFRDGELFYKNNKVYPPAILTAFGWVKKDILYYPKYNVKFLLPSFYDVLYETFVKEQYNVDVRGREAVDIGTNVGDTAIYFAIKGAKHVYAFEPLPSIAEIARKNVELNGLENRIDIINAGVSSRSGKIRVPSKIEIEKSGGFKVNNDGDIEVPLISMEDITRMVKDPYLLKIDCEGCEADIILNTRLDFEKIVFEHHRFLTKVSYDTLRNKLMEEGYNCTLKHAHPKIPPKELGIAYCSKI